MNAATSALETAQSFSTAAEQTLAELLGGPVQPGASHAQPGPLFPLSAVNIGVGLTGDLKGQVNFGMDMATALAIASTMMMEDVAELDEMAISALCEMANMIAGRARYFLNSGGMDSDITPPSVLIGDSINAVWHHVEAIAMPLALPNGKIQMTVGIQPGGH